MLSVRAYCHGLICVFFFSSRRRHTRFDCDWSSDVCSSDLRKLRHPHLGCDRTSRHDRDQPLSEFRGMDKNRVLDLDEPPGTQLLARFQHFAKRSEEHTSELQSQSNLVCRLLLEKKKKIDAIPRANIKRMEHKNLLLSKTMCVTRSITQSQIATTA